MATPAFFGEGNTPRCCPGDTLWRRYQKILGALVDGGPTPPADQGITTDPDGLIITTDDGLVIVPD